MDYLCTQVSICEQFNCVWLKAYWYMFFPEERSFVV